MNAATPTASKSVGKSTGEGQHDFVSFTVAGQLFGIPVLKVQDVLGPQRITRIPLAPKEVAGSLNLRGRIVTAIDLRLRLGLDRREKGQNSMSIVVEQNGELYSLIVDSVGEVLSLEGAAYERNPPTLDPRWRDFSDGIYRLNGSLLVVLDVSQLLQFAKAEAA
ncbi:chemotaxis protein CheW [Hypericibacter terrae]|jgi:purine-binding chemotaxis protein CheW|uniref:Chemotaxis protein CheW n=1 Tax=Hypericibacter terrae TaxID=2602015 RepID=A0A5J6MLR5_9PROT|nr:chemotaxis protein CheW [Hypericibacter terrae]QEX18303.1 chemotaxis protein CheW [Hypericibacter terrae]